MTLFQPPEPPRELPVHRPTPPVPPAMAASSTLQPLLPQQAHGFGYERQEWSLQPHPLPPRPPRDWTRTDRVVSIVLLGIGLFGAAIGIVTAFVLPLITRASYAASGEAFVESSGTGHTLQLLLWSHVLLYLVAVAATVLLLRRRSIAFYVPLIAGVVAAIAFWTVLAIYLSADHTMTFVA